MKSFSDEERILPGRAFHSSSTQERCYDVQSLATTSTTFISKCDEVIIGKAGEGVNDSV